MTDNKEVNLQNKTVYCRGLHHNTSQEVFYKHITEVCNISKQGQLMSSLKNLKFSQNTQTASLVFHKEEDAEKFRKLLNGTLLLQSSLMVTISKSAEQRADIWNNNVVFIKIFQDKDSDKTFSNYELDDFLASYGKVFLIRLNKNQKKAQDREVKGDFFGYVYFEQKEAADEVLREGTTMFQNDKFKIEFSKYEKTSVDATILTSKTVYIRDFEMTPFTQEQMLQENREALNLTLRDIQIKLHKEAENCGKCTTVVKVCDQKRLPFAFVNFDSQEDATKYLQQKQEEKAFVNYSIKRKKEQRTTDERKLLVKNLRETATLDMVKQFFGQFGEIHSCYLNTGMEIQVSQNSQKKITVNSAFLNYKDKASGEKCIRDYNRNTASSEYKDLFETSIREQCITLRMTKAERQKLKQFQKKSQSSSNSYIQNPSQEVVQNDLQTINPAQNFMYKPYSNNAFKQQNAFGKQPMPQFMMNQQGQFPQQQNYGRPPQQQHQPRPQQGVKPIINQAQRQVRENTQQQVQINQMTQQRQELINQQQQQQQQTQNKFATFEGIKKNRQEFDEASKDEQRNALGSIIFKKVKEMREKEKASKITGMLIDFEVFEISEIFELLEDDNIFQERVEEAENLIQEQQPN